MAPGSSVSANPLSRILKIYLSLKKKKKAFVYSWMYMYGKSRVWLG